MTLVSRSGNYLQALEGTSHFSSSHSFWPSLLLVLVSAVGISAVLSHRLPDGSEHSIGYVSGSLSKTECNYSQLEKEGLYCIFGIKHFHQYIFGIISFFSLTTNPYYLSSMNTIQPLPKHLLVFVVSLWNCLLTSALLNPDTHSFQCWCCKSTTSSCLSC